MSDRCLFVEVRLHDDRWHGAGEWPPSPLRLFQALLAAACLGRGEAPSEDETSALNHLASLGAPVIAAPASTSGRGVTLFVPNNDIDAVGGDPANISKIRAGKTAHPRLLNPDTPFVYVWPLADAAVPAEVLIRLAERLYQFGRGVDAAYARAELLEREAAEAWLAAHPGPIWRPAHESASGGIELRCPAQGTLQSLTVRHAAQTARLKDGALRQAPQPRYRMVGYNCPATILLFDLISSDPRRHFSTWPLTHAAQLTTAVRDGAAFRMKKEWPSETGTIERVLIGRNATEADKAIRVRITPVPSIGSPNADQSIRRVLIERPPDCPIRADDLAWAFSGLDLGVDYQTGQVVRQDQAVLAPSNDRTMLDHYGIESQAPARVWQTVTPAALPLQRPRGRHRGTDRSAHDAVAAHAAGQALRHAGVTTPVETVRVQREPFSGKGARAEAFATGPRFMADRLWHLEITFTAPVPGPLVIGDGRYCGLGLMAPTNDHLRDILLFSIQDDARPPHSNRPAVLAALRRALMSRAKDANGRVPALFSGHELDRGPAWSGHHRHVYLTAGDTDGDGLLDSIAIIAPWRVDRTWRPSRNDRASFEKVAVGLQIIRAGPAGVLPLQPAKEPDAEDPLFAPAQTWTSRTSYRPTRHPRRAADAAASAAEDILRECLRRGLPRPDIDITQVTTGPHGSTSAEARLHFSVAVKGPILLGRDAHRGGGLFTGERPH